MGKGLEEIFPKEEVLKKKNKKRYKWQTST